MCCLKCSLGWKDSILDDIVIIPYFYAQINIRSSCLLLSQAPLLWSHRMYLRALNKPGLSQVTKNTIQAIDCSTATPIQKV